MAERIIIVLRSLATTVAIIGVGVTSLAGCGGSDSESSAGGVDGADVSADAFCAALGDLGESGIDAEGDFDGALAALEDLASAAPAQVRDDVMTFIEVLKVANDAPDDSDFAEFEDDLEKMFAAIDNVQGYADDNCDGLAPDLLN